MARRTDMEIREELERLLEEVEVFKEKAQKRGCAFASLSEEELVKKLRGETSNSPFFTSWAWDQLTNSGSPSFYLANYHNPDPQTRLCFVTIFFGLAHLEPNVSAALAARDTRWPCVSTELTVLPPGGTGVADFKYFVPYAPKGTYFGNAILWEMNFTEPVGTLFDRTGPFYVTLK
jgi:hypothetical protein